MTKTKTKTMTPAATIATATDRHEAQRRCAGRSCTNRSSSSSQTLAGASDGARQSPRGDSEPPEPTFGPFGTAERLNWLAKNRSRNTRNQPATMVVVVVVVVVGVMAAAAGVVVARAEARCGRRRGRAPAARRVPAHRR